MVHLVRRLSLPIFVTAILSASCAGDYIEGFTEPYKTVDISIGEPGVIRQISVKPGQPVTKGDVIVELDTAVLEATLAMAKQKAAAKGSIEAAEAELQLREQRMLQIVQLRQRGHATQREYSRAQADTEIAKGRLKLAREEQMLNELDVIRIQAQIAQRRVESPVDGVISEVHREVGEALLITDPRIATLVQLNKLRARFSATPEQAATLYPNQPVKITLTQSDQLINAVVERISPVVDAKSGTVEVHVVMKNQNRKLRSGIRCLLEVEVTETADSSSLASAR